MNPIGLNKSEKIFLIIGVSATFAIISFFCYMAYSQWQLEKIMRSRGVTTTAVILKCISSQNSSSVLYEYSVKTNTGQKQTYQQQVFGGGRATDGCLPGKKVKLQYLPEQPEKIISSKSSYITTSIIGILAISFALFSILLEIFRSKNKHKKRA
jgi:hypothetical protein